MAKYDELVPRFLKYVKVNSRSDPDSTTIPSSQREVDFLHQLMKELEQIGMSEVKYNNANGYVTALLPSNMDKKVPTIGFMAHTDTADFNSEHVNPQIVENYDGESDIKLSADGKYELTVKDFPALKNYKGQTLITTDGTTLLGADDKAGVAEIMTAMDYLIQHPEIQHGNIKIGFSPDEEIGTGAEHFDVKDFDADFAYTMDGGPVGQLEYETFNAASLVVDVQGKDVHPGSAYGVMINANEVAIQFQNALPQEEVPEKTKGMDGFFHLLKFDGTVDHAHMEYIIRDFDRDQLNSRKDLAHRIGDKLNAEYGDGVVTVTTKDEYYNMGEVMKDHMDVVELAKNAMTALDITPEIEPVRGGTDGSTISFMGLPTPNIFAGAENMHGRYEFVSEDALEKGVDVILKIVELNNQ
ncbi:peptidase T [Lactobacillus selangorensis]|uniref:Peptidase T n=1 Tax=Lactobacillus selangorensis TaxID=81857 RepID=A0A0R2GAX4_9LACO|nr:peptidase T [Lactobacillus selangorensis]KRN29514.1 peptidase T [Lactobacillus selangorensis]KRN33956.1 peptidase T [Lactobacillus selangorensis]